MVRKKAPNKPEVEFSIKKDSLIVFWNHNNPSNIAHWVVYYKHKTQWNYTIHGSSIKSQKIPLYKINLNYLTKSDKLATNNIREVIDDLNTIAVSSVDKFGNESAVIEIPITNLTYENAPTLEDVLKLYNLKNKPL